MPQLSEGNRPAPLPVTELRQIPPGDPPHSPRALKPLGTSASIRVHLRLTFLAALLSCFAAQPRAKPPSAPHAGNSPGIAGRKQRTGQMRSRLRLELDQMPGAPHAAQTPPHVTFRRHSNHSAKPVSYITASPHVFAKLSPRSGKPPHARQPIRKFRAWPDTKDLHSEARSSCQENPACRR